MCLHVKYHRNISPIYLTILFAWFYIYQRLFSWEQSQGNTYQCRFVLSPCVFRVGTGILMLRLAWLETHKHTGVTINTTAPQTSSNMLSKKRPSVHFAANVPLLSRSDGKKTIQNSKPCNCKCSFFQPLSSKITYLAGKSTICEDVLPIQLHLHLCFFNLFCFLGCFQWPTGRSNSTQPANIVMTKHGTTSRCGTWTADRWLRHFFGGGQGCRTVWNTGNEKRKAQHTSSVDCIINNRHH